MLMNAYVPKKHVWTGEPSYVNVLMVGFGGNTVMCSQFAMKFLIDRFLRSSPECPARQRDLTFIVRVYYGHQDVAKSFGPLSSRPVHLSVTKCLEVVLEQPIAP